MEPRYVDLSDWMQIKISGPQTIEYLNGIITKDLHSMLENQVARSAFLTPQAHIRSVYWIKHSDGLVFIYCPGTMKKSLVEDLLKYKLSMDVKLEDISEETDHLYLVETGASIPGLSSQETGFEFMNLATPPSGESMSYDDFRQYLIQSGVVPPEEMRDKNPYEIGISDAISLEKGCFLGQEPISRMYHRGNPRKYVYQVKGDNLSIGSSLFFDDENVGEIIATSDDIGLAFIRRTADQLDNLEVKGNKIEVLCRIGTYPENER